MQKNTNNFFDLYNKVVIKKNKEVIITKEILNRCIISRTKTSKTLCRYKNGDILYFGSYPQSLVTNSDLINSLHTKAGSISKWNSYKYFCKNEDHTGNFGNDILAKDFMKYTDIKYKNEKYRGVYFSLYRPCFTNWTSSEKNSFQSKNGYFINTVYWFKYEPLECRVLDSNSGLVICNSIIDSQALNNYTVGTGRITFDRYNYENSSLHKWLNNDFYNTAFNIGKKANIKNNGCNVDVKSFGCKNAVNKIFVLSRKEAVNSEYGFDLLLTPDSARCMYATDYAQCQGCYVSKTPEYLNTSYWLLRSGSINTFSNDSVGHDGSIDLGSCPINCTDYGIVPAFRINKLYYYANE